MEKINKIISLFKTIGGIFIAIIPFFCGIGYAFSEANTFLWMIAVIVLGLSGSFVIIGILSEAKGNHGGGVVSFLGLFVAVISGFMFLVNWFLK